MSKKYLLFLHFAFLNPEFSRIANITISCQASFQRQDRLTVEEETTVASVFFFF
jgi:hypothetical protein